MCVRSSFIDAYLYRTKMADLFLEISQFHGIYVENMHVADLGKALINIDRSHC